MTDAVIVPNAGSTSMKLGAYGVDATKTLPLRAEACNTAEVDPHFVAKDKNDKPLDVQAWGEGQAINHKTALQFVITGWIRR